MKSSKKIGKTKLTVQGTVYACFVCKCSLHICNALLLLYN